MHGEISILNRSAALLKQEMMKQRIEIYYLDKNRQEQKTVLPLSGKIWPVRVKIDKIWINTTGAFRGSDIHELISADFMMRVPGAATLHLIGGAAAAQQMNASVKHTSANPKGAQQHKYGARKRKGEGEPDLVQIDGKFLYIAEIKPNNILQLAGGAIQRDHYIQKAKNALNRTFVKGAAPASDKLIVKMMPKNVYNPPKKLRAKTTRGNPGGPYKFDVYIKTQWIQDGLLSYSVYDMKNHLILSAAQLNMLLKVVNPGFQHHVS